MVVIGSILFLMLCVFLTWRNTEYGALFLLATTPLYLVRLSLGPLPTTLFELQLLLFVGVVCVQKKREILKTLIPRNNLEKALLVSIAAFLISASVSAVVSPDIRAALGVWRAYFVEPILFFVVVVSVVKTPSSVWRMIGALSIPSFIIAFYALLQVFAGFPIPKPWDVELRATSIFPYPNAVGLFIAPIIALVVAYICRAATWKKISAIAMSIVLLVGIALAKTVGALVALGAAGLLWGSFWSKSTRQWIIRIFVVCTLVVVVLPSVKAPIEKKLFFHEWSGTVRQIVWKETIPMLRDHWLTGAGLAGYQKTFEPYHKTKAIEIFLYPHNIVLNFWSEIGLYGLTSVIALIAIYFILLICSRSREQRALRFGLMGAMAVIVVHGVVDVPYFKNDLAIVWWTLFACAFVLYRHHQTQHGK